MLDRWVEHYYGIAAILKKAPSQEGTLSPSPHAAISDKPYKRCYRKGESRLRTT